MKEVEETSPYVLVFVVTASGDEEVAVEALRKGVLDHLNKARGKNILSRPETQSQPGKLPSAVTLSQNHKIQQAVRFINDHYHTDIRLDAVAGETGMSPSHFSRTFKKMMGRSYQAYLNGCRITKAKSLLRTTPRSIAEIADSIGFADPTGFGRIFKKLTGQTPSAYRSLPRDGCYYQKEQKKPSARQKKPRQKLSNPVSVSAFSDLSDGSAQIKNSRGTGKEVYDRKRGS
jgi:AraC-like DNA-binding protein